jgi:NADH:ubiquinone oxidoreductase subunit 5 (subunit L)/multisubunit Na+/H+ antiporter MnhA subunit
VLGFAGALLHVINHALFKGLLFLGAGAVAHATGTRELDHLGGLLKRMPLTAATFLIGAVAISGLPPLNGFVSEFLIYIGAYRGATAVDVNAAVPGLGVIVGLALIGGLAMACFTKAFGIVFLGEPRSDHASHAHDPGWAMRGPMLVLALGCGLIGLLAPFAIRFLAPALVNVTKLSPGAVRDELAVAVNPLWFITGAGVGLMALIGGLGWLRHKLLAGRSVQTAVTWDCGYARPTARMQYTASSFAQPLTGLFASLLRTRRKFTPPSGIFPQSSSLATETPDVANEVVYRPVFAGIDGALSRWRWLQRGNVHLYVLYIALTLLVLLIWKLG